MRRADEALYKAKKNGRDSVRLSYERAETVFILIRQAVSDASSS